MKPLLLRNILSSPSQMQYARAQELIFAELSPSSGCGTVLERVCLRQTRSRTSLKLKMTTGGSLDWVASIEDYTPTVSKGATYKMVMGGCSMVVCTIWELVPYQAIYFRLQKGTGG